MKTIKSNSNKGRVKATKKTTKTKTKTSTAMGRQQLLLIFLSRRCCNPVMCCCALVVVAVFVASFRLGLVVACLVYVPSAPRRPCSPRCLQHRCAPLALPSLDAAASAASAAAAAVCCQCCCCLRLSRVVGGVGRIA